jgi:hypothetical protein
VLHPAGKLADAESMVALKDLANRLGSGNIWHDGGFPELSGECKRGRGFSGFGVWVWGVGWGGACVVWSCGCSDAREWDLGLQMHMYFHTPA